MTIFGQIVIGPPGSGKTTYTGGMAHFLRSLGRKVSVINLDPANDSALLPYEADVDIAELIQLEDVSVTYFVMRSYAHVSNSYCLLRL